MCFSLVGTGATVALWPAGDFTSRHIEETKSSCVASIIICISSPACWTVEDYGFMSGCSYSLNILQNYIFFMQPNRSTWSTLVMTLKIWTLQHSGNVCENIHSCPSHWATYRSVTPSRGFPVIATQLIPYFNSHCDKKKLGKILQARIQGEERRGGVLSILAARLICWATIPPAPWEVAAEESGPVPS